VLRTAEEVRKKSDAPLVLMSYANPLFCRGWMKSVREISRAGFDGAIVPDLIPEESRQVRNLFRKEGLSLIYLCAPTSPIQRIRRICGRSSGFVYCVSITGVTGARNVLPAGETRKFLKKVKNLSRLPVLLGFGISRPGHLDSFRDCADGFIIGSALIRVLGGQKGSRSLIRRAKNFIIPFARKIGVQPALRSR
jgi:tryptophan synthase alpha chain